MTSKKNITSRNGFKYVYVAGPLTKGDPFLNIREAILAGDCIALHGHFPFIPHLFQQCHSLRPRDYEFWMKLDMAWLERCDVVVRLPGESLGADRETARAIELGIPVYFGLDEFMKSKDWD